MTYYQVLELTPLASTADIKRAWHEQLQVWHPDRFTHAPTLHRKAEVRTQLINQAYQTLSDPVLRQRYDALTKPESVREAPATAADSARPTSPPRPQPAANRPARPEPRGPHLPVTLSRQNQPKITVPTIHMLVDSRQHQPYEFRGLKRIAGTVRQTLPAGDYAIEEAPDIFRVVRKRVEEFNTIFSNPTDNRRPFMQELEPLRNVPHRFLVIEGAIQARLAGGRLGQYHKNGLMDFLDAITARYGMHIIYTDGRDEAEERIANLASLHYAYHYAEEEGLGRYLVEGDF
ncbi:MAG: DnaJ domain-containing protein [Nitrospira sp.]